MVAGEFPINVTWFYVRYPGDKREALSSETLPATGSNWEQKSTLVLKGVSPSKNGYYICGVSNYLGKDEKIAALLVSGE